MREIFGISLKSIKEHHVNHLIKTFANKEKTTSRVKELQSSIIFFNKFTESQNVGMEWKNKYAKNVNISVVIGTLKYLGKILGIPLHRICKTAYTVYVYISHYYNKLNEYLETFQCFEIDKKNVYPTVQNPFNYCEKFISSHNYTQESIEYATQVLASSIKAQQDLNIEAVVCIKDPKTQKPIFLAFKKEHGKLIPIINEEEEKTQSPKAEIIEKIETKDCIPLELCIEYLMNDRSQLV